MSKGAVEAATFLRAGRMFESSLLSGRAWKKVRCASSLFTLAGKYFFRRSVMRAWWAASVCKVRI